MRKLVLSLVFAIAPSAPCLAAEQGLGFTAGLSGGLGTHYRTVWDSGWGVGGSASAWSAGREIAYSAGVQVLRVVSENRHGRLYGLGGLGVTQPHLQAGPAIWAVGSGLGIQIGKGPGPTFSVEGQVSLFGNAAMGWVLAPLPSASLIYYY